ncbi:MAG: peptidoglycan-binding domain-containing protein [Candidatus Omnitrophota bacterium]|nr:peptidoglycan-binding domain-containing protein [Candidatus Omnitrophota bacterium]
MKGGSVIWLAGMAMLLGGCAGGRYRQELTRLQSQVGLLDERLTQLERSPLSEGSAAAPSDLGATTISSAPLQGRSAPETPRPSARSSEKPKTDEIQRALKNAGFYQGSVDGKMGPQTREAVREFQRIHGLQEDGVVGKATWAKLRTYADLSAGSSELSGTEVLK